MAERIWVPDRRFLDQLGRSPDVGRVCLQAAHRGAEWARNEARKSSRTGQYANSFRVEPMVVTVSGKKRLGARIVNDAVRTRPDGTQESYGWAVEWGHGGKHILQRTVDVIEKGRG